MESRVAFLILAHDDIHHLHRLCRALGSEDDIYIHIDRKVPLHPELVADFPSNVTFVTPRVAAHWADVSIVEATVKLVEAALNRGRNYLRLVLLSGACYPIKPVDALRQRFLRARTRNDIRFGLLDRSDRRWKVSRFHFRAPALPGWNRSGSLRLADRLARKAVELALRPIDRGFENRFPGIVPYFGSQFWAITPECARFILDYLALRPDFLDYYRHTWAPDEHLFHTIVGNSPFARTTEGPIGPNANPSRLTNLHYIPERFFIPGSRGTTWVTLEDLDGILQSDRFFVRKVRTGLSDELLDQLDNLVHGEAAAFASAQARRPRTPQRSGIAIDLPVSGALSGFMSFAPFVDLVA